MNDPLEEPVWCLMQEVLGPRALAEPDVATAMDRAYIAGCQATKFDSIIPITEMLLELSVVIASRGINLSEWQSHRETFLAQVKPHVEVYCRMVSAVRTYLGGLVDTPNDDQKHIIEQALVEAAAIFRSFNYLFSNRVDEELVDVAVNTSLYLGVGAVQAGQTLDALRASLQGARNN